MWLLFLFAFGAEGISGEISNGFSFDGEHRITIDLARDVNSDSKLQGAHFVSDLAISANTRIPPYAHNAQNKELTFDSGSRDSKFNTHFASAADPHGIGIHDNPDLSTFNDKNLYYSNHFADASVKDPFFTIPVVEDVFGNAGKAKSISSSVNEVKGKRMFDKASIKDPFPKSDISKDELYVSNTYDLNDRNGYKFDNIVAVGSNNDKLNVNSDIIESGFKVVEDNTPILKSLSEKQKDDDSCPNEESTRTFHSITKNRNCLLRYKKGNNVEIVKEQESQYHDTDISLITPEDENNALSPDLDSERKIHNAKYTASITHAKKENLYKGQVLGENDRSSQPFRETQEASTGFEFIKTDPSVDGSISKLANEMASQSDSSNEIEVSIPDLVEDRQIPANNTIDDLHESLQHSFFNSFNSSFKSLVFNPSALSHERFQQCSTPKNESGNCRYLQHCLLPHIVSSLDRFMEYVCIIEGAFIGVCCPEFPVETLTVEWAGSPNPTNAAEAVFAPEECGITSKTRIVGGSKADPKDWPWMAALFSKSRRRFFCGGALINNLYVLTAAHCTFGVRRNEIIARLGEYDFKDTNSSTRQEFQIVQIKRHGQYSRRTLRNDLALLKLDRPVHFSEFVSTICLPEDHEDYVNENVTLAGWGNIRGGGSGSKILMEASFPVWANRECARAHRLPIPPALICTGTKTRDKGACNGDSGGPLMLLDKDNKWKTIGVVSWGRRGCNPKFPTVYTRVTHYLDWIKMHSND